MGTSHSFDELARKLDQAAKNLEKSTPKTILAATVAAQVPIEAEIRGRVPDGDMSGLSGIRRSRRGKRLKSKSGKVGTKIVKARKYGDDAMAVRAVGPVHWLEAGTRAHIVGEGRASSTGERKHAGARKLMNIGSSADGFGRVVTGPLHHPGMPAGHTWSKGLRRATPVARTVFERRATADALAPFL